MCDIVVPLDGTSCAEQALPWGQAIATRTGGTLHLVQVDLPLRVPTCQEVLGQRRGDALRRLAEERRDRERAYLREIEAGLLRGAERPRVETALLRGPLWSALLEHGERAGATLFVVATRARQPLNRAWLGSVTDDLIRRSRVPVLLIRAHEEFAGAAPGLGRLLVPLDGSSGAERVIPHAVALARAFDAELQLVRVCGPREDALEAERYLAEVRARLRPTGVAAESLIVAHHDVAEALADAAEERGAEVLALASRYRGGLSRLVFGNIPESLVRLGSRPVFVVGERVPAPHGADTRVVAWS